MDADRWNPEKEETACEPPDGPKPCANNCGFYGAPSTGNMCSKCYKATVQKQSSAKAAEREKLQGALHPSPSQAAETSVAEIAKVVTSSMTPSPAGEGVAVTHIDEAVTLAVARMEMSAISIPSRSQSTMGVASSARPAMVTPASNRCFSCNKRLGLAGFKCKCDLVFCGTHRYSDKHQCTFDYKTAGRETIAKANPLVKAEKLDKI